MKKKLFYISLMVGVMSLSACSKLLEEKSQSEVIPTTTQDYKELLMGSGYIGNREPASFLYMMDDDVTFNLEYPTDPFPVFGTDGAVIDFPKYSWQPYFADRNGLGQFIAEDPVSTSYAMYYERIMGCNAVLDNIDKSIGTQAEKDRVKGEALAVRAHIYFSLVNLYGDPYSANPAALGVPLKLESGVSAEYTVRNTVGEVYNQIVNDLKEASRLLDPLQIIRRDYHINQPAIHILLSRVYLHMEKWDDVVAETNKAFEQGARLTDLKSYTAAPLFTYDNPEVEWMFGATPADGSESIYKVPDDFITSFDPKDIRRILGYTQPSAANSVLIIKYRRTTSEMVQSIRSSEAVLNRAEAYAQLNKVAEAVKDLNDLRRSRIRDYVDVSISDKTAALNAIRDERRKEFCHEGFRWFDLRRYGRPSISHRYQAQPGQAPVVYKLEEKDPMYTLPFPNVLVLRNPKLRQNPSATMSERAPQ